MAQRGAAARSTDRFERKREAILDAATRILNRKGVKGLTLSDAAAAVDLSTTSVTYYFKRKDDLAAAVITRGTEPYIERAGRGVKKPSPPDRLRELLPLSFERMRQRGGEDPPPLPVISDMRALNEPRREEVSVA